MKPQPDVHELLRGLLADGYLEVRVKPDGQPGFYLTPAGLAFLDSPRTTIVEHREVGGTGDLPQVRGGPTSRRARHPRPVSPEHELTK